VYNSDFWRGGLCYIHERRREKYNWPVSTQVHCSHNVANIYKYQIFVSHTKSGNTTLERLGMRNLERQRRTNLKSCFHSFYSEVYYSDATWYLYQRNRQIALNKHQDKPKGFRMAQTWTDRETTSAFPWMDCGKQHITSINIIPGQQSNRTSFAHNNTVQSLYTDSCCHKLCLTSEIYWFSKAPCNNTQHMDRPQTVSYSYRFLAIKSYAM